MKRLISIFGLLLCACNKQDAESSKAAAEKRAEQTAAGERRRAKESIAQAAVADKPARDAIGLHKEHVARLRKEIRETAKGGARELMIQDIKASEKAIAELKAKLSTRHDARKETHAAPGATESAPAKP